jgi:hypothetical protein
VDRCVAPSADFLVLLSNRLDEYSLVAVMEHHIITRRSLEISIFQLTLTWTAYAKRWLTSEPCPNIVPVAPASSGVNHDEPTVLA